jgi:hypothetical protein
MQHAMKLNKIKWVIISIGIKIFLGSVDLYDSFENLEKTKAYDEVYL